MFNTWYRYPVDMISGSSHNVVLICLDSVRKDFFDIYGQRLQKVADTEFTQCRAASSWSTPSHASMFTGQLPHQHGIHTHDRSFESLTQEETFLSNLDRYTTLCVSVNVFASSAYGFDQMFHICDEPSPARRYPDALSIPEFVDQSDSSGIEQYIRYLAAALGHEHPLQSLANGILGKLQQFESVRSISNMFDMDVSAVTDVAKRRIKDVEEPYFAFLNVMDAHVPLQHTRGFDESLYDVPRTWTTAERGVWELFDQSRDHTEYWRKRRMLYGAAIEYLDRHILRFVEHLLADSELETTIIITADHGENLGYEADGYLPNHKSSLSEGLLHVPLWIINPPQGYDATETGYFSHLDLGRLITGMARGKTPDVFRKRIPTEVIGLSAGPEPPENYDYDELDRMIRCIYNEEQKIEWDSLGRSVKYDLDYKRPSWQTKTAENAEIPEWAVAHFDTPIKDSKICAQKQSRSQAIDSTTASRLEELGYL